jgi:hypothetical protein
LTAAATVAARLTAAAISLPLPPTTVAVASGVVGDEW